MHTHAHAPLDDDDVPSLKAKLAEAMRELEVLRSRVRTQQRHTEQLQTKLQRACPHEHVESKRESGHYGRRYQECRECLKMW